MVIRHKDGIRFTISTGGVISEIDMALVFETFIQAFLLLNLANIICKFIAYNLLGIKSRMFYLFGEYKVNYELEYANQHHVPIIPVQMCEEWPPNSDDDKDENGYVEPRCNSGFRKNTFVLKPDLVRLVWNAAQDKPWREAWDADACAREIKANIERGGFPVMM